MAVGQPGRRHRSSRPGDWQSYVHSFFHIVGIAGHCHDRARVSSINEWSSRKKYVGLQDVGLISMRKAAA
jgi:hypothetical protein